ncbi:hypothetical protein [Clostridium tertium]|uniref:hypothetical protein n=1 Tax=Clostridium tertium TaxID=1559 RepID=UPI0023B326B0|nr:hypothetical protein [Clostridium tertium]
MEEMNIDKDIIVSKNKCITNKSFVADINSLKLPLFMYGNYTPERDENGKVKPIEEKKYSWIDSQNQSRELYMYCKGKLPRQFESDTWHGLLGLFVKKNAPFPYNSETNKYDIDTNELEFSWYELCNFMKIQSSGYYIEKLKSAIRTLKETQYFSYEKGAWYDKKNNRYLKSGESGMSLLSDYKFKTIRKEAPNDEYSVEISKNIVYFNEYTMNSLRYEYFKYLDSEMYFDLIPSGIERGLYSYLEANRYDRSNKSLKYIKRNYNTLKIAIPIDFNYPSELKRKVRKPLNHLKKIGYLSDWCFGDEIKINGIKEPCIYFCYGLCVADLKDILESKFLKGQQSEFDITYDKEDPNDEDIVSNVEYLKLPTKPLVDELVDRKLDKIFANTTVKKKDKWLIIKYILWVDKQLMLNKTIDTGALLGFALRREEELNLGKDYEDINEFIELEKQKEEDSGKVRIDNFKKAYDEYIDSEMKLFMETPEYNIIKDVLLQNIDENRINSIISVGIANNSDVSKYKEFLEKKENSVYFKELLIKEVRLAKNLMSYEDFIVSNNKL